MKMWVHDMWIAFSHFGLALEGLPEGEEWLCKQTSGCTTEFHIQS